MITLIFRDIIGQCKKIKHIGENKEKVFESIHEYFLKVFVFTL